MVLKLPAVFRQQQEIPCGANGAFKGTLVNMRGWSAVLIEGGWSAVWGLGRTLGWETGKRKVPAREHE